MAQILSEDQFQALCFQWHWNTFVEDRQMLFHVQQKARNKIEGAMFKAKGVVRGVSDLVLILPGGCVAWIELKWDKGTQFDEQKTFEAKVKQRGHRYFVVKATPETWPQAFEEFKQLIWRLYGKVST